MATTGHIAGELAALVFFALVGCAPHTAAPDAALPSSSSADAASEPEDAAAPPPSAPRASVEMVIPVGREEAASDAAAGTWQPATCGAEAEPLSVAGSSPLGPLRVTSVGVRYWSGFTYGTGLRLEGKLGDQDMVLTVENATVPTDQGLRPELPPGRYRPGDSWDDLYVTLIARDSSISLRDAELTIEQHNSTLPLRRGSPVALRGTLRIFESGWSLDVPFAITSVCETNFEGSPP